MIRIAIVEDDKESQQLLIDYIAQYEKENSLLFDVTVFQDGLEITETEAGKWDIIFMDIKMKHMDGMTAAKKIREFDSAVIIIFITSMAKFAIRGYEVDALDFVLKPLKYQQFITKINKALNTLKKIKEHKFLLLPVGDKKERVSTDDTFYIEVKTHNLYIYTENDTYCIRYSMSRLEKELEEYHFSRCSNSYLVNLKNVSAIEKDVTILGKYRIPISRTRKKQFLEAISSYLGGYNG